MQDWQLYFPAWLQVKIHDVDVKTSFTHFFPILCRGGADIKEIVKRIDMWALDMVFVVGGNGGNAGANAIQQELNKHNIPCSVIGVPKSIDNDILLVGYTFLHYFYLSNWGE